MKIFDLSGQCRDLARLLQNMAVIGLCKGTVRALSHDLQVERWYVASSFPSSYSCDDYLNDIPVFLVTRGMSRRRLSGTFSASMRWQMCQDYVDVPDDQEQTPSSPILQRLKNIFDSSSLRSELVNRAKKNNPDFEPVGLPEDFPMEAMGDNESYDKSVCHDMLACYVPENGGGNGGAIFLWIDKIANEFDSLSPNINSKFERFLFDILIHEIGHALMDSCKQKMAVPLFVRYLIEEPLATAISLEQCGQYYRKHASRQPFPYVYGLNFCGDRNWLQNSIRIWREVKFGNAHGLPFHIGVSFPNILNVLDLFKYLICERHTN